MSAQNVLAPNAQSITLDDKYTAAAGPIFLTGIQALVRLPLMQRARDRRAGYNTAGFISGYRGSPLGGIDAQLWAAEKHLNANDIKFVPGVNEDLAATAVRGSQQVGLAPGARVDGVFSMWYGKAPGVDRSGDAIRHANAAGTAALGGALAIAGDDHTCKSSTWPSQSEFAFMDWEIPIFTPANIREVIEYGLYGWAMSRFAGVWTSLICHADLMDSSASIDIDANFAPTTLPLDFALPPGGLSIRNNDVPTHQEQRLRNFKTPAVKAFIRANGLNKTTLDNPRGRLGIITLGKAYTALRQALDNMGITDEVARSLGLKIYKLAMPWPLEMDGVQEFARGLEEVFVIEEKRALVETQIKEALYGLPESQRPRVVGKHDETGAPLLRNTLDLPAEQIARALAKRIPEAQHTPRMRAHLELMKQKVIQIDTIRLHHERKPYFCSGCPHNTSTRVPDGSRALAGIGCHYMALFMPERKADTFTQMGGEGTPWIGQAPFTDEDHIFANLGDGTYFHSGLLAIRAAVAANVNITYKILYNDAVAMTGGQPVDGELTVPQISHQVVAEGVKHVVVVSDDIDKWSGNPEFAPGVTFEHRDNLNTVQKQLREMPGVTVLIYDQTCAAEKRRRRKRKLMDDPPQRVFINERVCEGCGDCSVQSNCLSVEQVKTEYGTKRRIDQSSCNKDFSCLKGFCPSFVTVHGAQPRKAEALDPQELVTSLPEPVGPVLSDEIYGIQLTGIGGTGVTSVTAMLAMAAHLEGKETRTLDMTGLAQKGGAVYSHLRIAPKGTKIHGPKLGVGGADLILACDVVTGAHTDVLYTAEKNRTDAVINEDVLPTADIVGKQDIEYDTAAMVTEIRRATRSLAGVNATRIARKLLGDSLFSNMLLLGYAYQSGNVPLSGAAIERAIELNGAAIDKNKQAFNWGRIAAHAPGEIEALIEPKRRARNTLSLDELIERRAADLVAYQNAGYANAYKSFVDQVATAEKQKTNTSSLTRAVAINLYKLMAYKDEYEVARLYSDGDFRKSLKSAFDGAGKIEIHMSPPILCKPDPETGRPPKIALGGWMLGAMPVLAAFKFLRGSWADPFGRSAERHTERQLIIDYKTQISSLMTDLTHDNIDTIVEIAKIPEHIRGYGPVKEQSIQNAKAREQGLIAHLSASPLPQAAE